MMIIPTIFAESKKQFKIRFKKIISFAKNIQIDFMDGKFVSSKSISPEDIPDLRKFDKKIKIQVDGGVNSQVIIKLSKLHVNYINSGSFISESKAPKEAFKKLSYLLRIKR